MSLFAIDAQVTGYERHIVKADSEEEAMQKYEARQFERIEPYSAVMLNYHTEPIKLPSIKDVTDFNEGF